MTGWLHFIPKTEYHRAQFVKEAEHLGVARRVPVHFLKYMEWGDLVACMMDKGEAGVKSPVMFLEFPITSLSGLTPEALKAVAGMYPCKVYDLGGELVSRRTGQYATQLSYYVDACLGGIAELLKSLEARRVEIGFPMLGCEGSEVKLIPRPFPIFRGTPANPEPFMMYDREKVFQEIAGWRLQKKRPQLASYSQIPEEEMFREAMVGGGPIEDYPGRVAATILTSAA